MKWILIGKITSSVGLAGEVKVYSYAEQADRFEGLSKVLLSKKEVDFADNLEGIESQIERVAHRSNMLVVKFKDCNDRDKADRLRGNFIYMRQDDLEDLPEGSFYIHEIKGFQVLSTEGVEIGRLKDVNTQTAQQLYVVERPSGKEVYIPGVPAFIDRIDPDGKKIFVNLIEGIIDED